MDYKQKYELALENIKKIKNANKDNKSLVDFIEYKYPELKESEDERIRKELIDFFKSRDYNCSKRFISWLEKQGEQKPADKVEPKFKVGDFIINEYGFIMQIDGIYGNMYLYHVLDNNNVFKHDITKTEESCHLWTIQDAKDGDVLVTHLSPEGDWTGIYKQSTGDTFKTHCYLNTVGEFVMNPNRCKNHGTHGLHPATKEQHDLLFQKMKEAGYEWDADKKELKKIEQKPNFCHHEVDLSNCSEEYRKAYYDGWNNCNQQHSQLKAEQKPAWSEEDEEISHCLQYTVKHYYDDKDTINKCCSWLKSIKQRIKEG